MSQESLERISRPGIKTKLACEEGDGATANAVDAWEPGRST